MLAYTSRNVPLAVLVLMLNVVNLGICVRLKGKRGYRDQPHTDCSTCSPGSIHTLLRLRLPDRAALTDALSKSVEQLEGVQQEFLALPLEGGLRELQQQALCLQKLRAMADVWNGMQFGYRCVGGCFWGWLLPSGQAFLLHGCSVLQTQLSRSCAAASPFP